MATQKRVSLDWEAIERDWRTGSFTLRELADKHKTDAATISRRQKKDKATDPTRWAKDLTEVVRQATNAKLMGALINEKVNKGQQEVNNVVLAAAQANTDVILRHRTDILATRDLAMDMLHELKLATHSPADLRGIMDLAGMAINDDEVQALRQSFEDLVRLPTRVASIHKLSDTLTKLQNLERKAFSLDDDDPSKRDAAGRELSDVERATRLASIMERAQRAKAGQQ